MSEQKLASASSNNLPGSHVWLLVSQTHNSEEPMVRQSRRRRLSIIDGIIAREITVLFRRSPSKQARRNRPCVCFLSPIHIYIYIYKYVYVYVYTYTYFAPQNGDCAAFQGFGRHGAKRLLVYELLSGGDVHRRPGRGHPHPLVRRPEDATRAWDYLDLPMHFVPVWVPE